MSLLIQKQGILDTVQDLGRAGFRRFGINPNGAMDQSAARLINILLGNRDSEAVLEMHFPAPEILFEERAVFALGGADFSARLNDRVIENWRPFAASKGDLLKFEKKVSGHRAYLAIKEGFQIKAWLESSSTNLAAKVGGFEGRKMHTGDRLRLNSKSNNHNSKFNWKISNSLIPPYSRFPTIRVVAGAEYHLLSASDRRAFFTENFVISRQSDRMGFRLEGSPLAARRDKELISSAVNFGTVQLLTGGQLIVLMADHQTSGGYPRLAHIIPADLPLLAQLGPNEKIGFHLISLEEAESLWLDFENGLNLLRLGCRFKL